MNLQAAKNQIHNLQSSINMEDLLQGDSFRPSRLYLGGWAFFTIQAQINETDVGDLPNVPPETCAELAYIFDISAEEVAGMINPDTAEDFATGMKLISQITQHLDKITGERKPTSQTKRILRRWAARVVTTINALGEDPGHDAKALHSAITLAAMLRNVSESDVYKAWVDSVRSEATTLVQSLV